ncbi:MAG: SoxR reducing system RseC family protein [Salinivirgaceae bacterium]|nr:SoxR reducing system RseC family protein [Salinivirgaceae bacterium]MDD4745657.1 SoxR reducing system RseC family protein [Salinivirgaceae bacterium]MDY0279305.1 SoxR reducing system RseC family protein [Salinivirgaceae bacterium]
MIEHTGKILSIEKNIARISLQQTSACASCHAKGACTSADVQERHITATIDDQGYKVGEEVLVNLRTQQGYKAVLVAYIIPFIIILITLIIGDQMGLEEWKSGIASLLITVIYFFYIKFYGNKYTNTMTFEIKKITN